MNNFHLEYYQLINNFWQLDKERHFSHLEIHLYFVLLKKWFEKNSGGGQKSTIDMLNSHLEKEVRTRSKNLIEARNKLINSGLVEVSKDFKRKQVSYNILYLTKETNVKLYPTKESLYLTKESNTKSNLTKPDIENLTKPEQRKGNITGHELNFAEPEYRELIKTFISYRIELGKPFKTTYGIEQFYNELKELSNNNIRKAKELINYAMGREWLSVYPIKTKNKSYRKRKLYRNEDIPFYDDKIS